MADATAPLNINAGSVYYARIIEDPCIALHRSPLRSERQSIRFVQSTDALTALWSPSMATGVCLIFDLCILIFDPVWLNWAVSKRAFLTQVLTQNRKNWYALESIKAKLLLKPFHQSVPNGQESAAKIPRPILLSSRSGVRVPPGVPGLPSAVNE